jgi:hypothetical protein
MSGLRLKKNEVPKCALVSGGKALDEKRAHSLTSIVLGEELKVLDSKVDWLT